MVWRQAKWSEPLIFEIPSLERSYVPIPFEDEFRDLEQEVMAAFRDILRENINIPNLSELVVVRHFTRLSQQSYGVDVGIVPLGSCTMKYNPKICNEALRTLALEEIHPEDLEEFIQGLLEIIAQTERWLEELTGMDRCTFQVPAGAAGEFAGALIIKRYHLDKGEYRDEMLVPDSAHGTNPASAAMAGFKVIKIPTASDGTVDIQALKSVVSNRTAGIMLTNPNTLGIFEHRILEIADIIHSAGGLLYYDGANLNGILGIARPGDMGFDIVHLNLHKTFAAPHGGGGPGGAALCVKKELMPYLPRPLLEFDGKKYYWDYSCDKCIGIIRAYYGNIPAVIRTFVYIAMLGFEGLREVCKISVLNTNYFIKKLLTRTDDYILPYEPSKPRKHELVLSATPLKQRTGVTAEDVAKALINQGLHAPTIYFPLIVDEALMVELTETEPIFEIDRYAEALIEIARTAHEDSKRLKELPVNTTVKRLDLVRANHPKTLVLSTKFRKEFEELNKELKSR